MSMPRRSFTQVPYQYGDGRFGTAIGQTRNGIEELVQLVGLMEYDPVSGLWAPPGVHPNPARFRVDAQLSVSNVQPIVRNINPGLLAAGASYLDNGVDLTQPPGIAAIALMVDCDGLVECELAMVMDASQSPSSETTKVLVVLPPTSAAGRPWWIPPFRLVGSSYRWKFRNVGSAAWTRVSIKEYRYTSLPYQPQNLRATLIYNAAIRDTGTHTFFTDPATFFTVIRTGLGGGKVPIYIRNTLDQAVDVTVVLELPGVGSWALGTKSVPAGSNGLITNADFPGIDVPSERLALNAKCSVAPTSGALTAYVDILVGGSA